VDSWNFALPNLFRIFLAQSDLLTLFLSEVKTATKVDFIATTRLSSIHEGAGAAVLCRMRSNRRQSFLIDSVRVDVGLLADYRRSTAIYLCEFHPDLLFDSFVVKFDDKIFSDVGLLLCCDAFLFIAAVASAKDRLVHQYAVLDI